MNGAVWTLLGGLLTAAVALITFRWQLPKIRAEARKANAEASHTEFQTLREHVALLEQRIATQGVRIAELEAADTRRAGREAELEKENRSLKLKVRKLESRIAGLEAVFKIGPVPPEMQAELDKLKDVE